jgi:hypothetical protein
MASPAKRRPAQSSGRTASKPTPPRGRPFQPGQSGNPGGRPRVADLIDTYAGKGGTKILQALALIAVGHPAQRKAFFGETTRVSAKDRIHAAAILADRRFGKAVETVDLTHRGATKVVHQHLPADAPAVKGIA